MDDQSQSDELYPIAVLIDELKVRILPKRSSEGAVRLQRRGYILMHIR